MKFPQYLFAVFPVLTVVPPSAKSGTWKTQQIKQKWALAPSTTRQNLLIISSL